MFRPASHPERATNTSGSQGREPNTTQGGNYNDY